jgi:nanoRNase/pAp phosphatase (c-di-AMP/oligoRNAs hydrolase)
LEEYRIDQERASWGQFFEGKSAPIDYWMVGELVREIKVGESILMDRWNRNGVVKKGIFVSSTVKKIEEQENCTYITTLNSLYKLENVEDDEIWRYKN